MRTLRIYSLNHFRMYHSGVNQSHHVIYYTPSTNRKLVPFDHLHLIPPTPTPPTSGNYKTDLSFCDFVLDCTYTVFALESDFLNGAWFLMIFFMHSASWGWAGKNVSHNIMQCISKHNARLLRLCHVFPDNVGNHFHQKKSIRALGIRHSHQVATFCFRWLT